MKIGIVGFGFVGKAAYNGFARKISVPHFKLYVYDKFVPQGEIIDWIYKQRCKDPVLCSDLIPMSECDFIFICVPTPTDFEKCEQDTSIVEDIVNEICVEARQGHIRPSIVIKSTVKPGTTTKLQEQNPEFNIMFNPEFLVENTYLEDFLNQDRIVLGGHDTSNLVTLYRLGWPKAKYFPMSTTEAELVKYAANAFLSVKISFWNEMNILAAALGIDYTVVRDAVVADERIGSWGSIVPGPDGQFGFGGKCFPKDLVTLLRLQYDLKVPNLTCKGSWITNIDVREKKDWLDIKGASTKNLHG